MKERKRKRRTRKKGCVLIIFLLIMSTAFFTFFSITSPTIESYAKLHGLKQSDWPNELVALLESNPETQDYVLNYPLNKNKDFEIDLSKYSTTDEVPLLLQWDERWGYNMYAGELMGLSGCGPTCLSMVSIYLLNDTSLSPEYIADFAEKNGYCALGNGSTWTLISEGGNKLGLDVQETPFDEETIKENLLYGNPIICIMGPGHFTSSGHFVVMTEYKKGKVRFNDPNSISRSEQWWELTEIEDEIFNLWICRSK